MTNTVPVLPATLTELAPQIQVYIQAADELAALQMIGVDVERPYYVLMALLDAYTSERWLAYDKAVNDAVSRFTDARRTHR